jgi:hypothetical protein
MHRHVPHRSRATAWTLLLAFVVVLTATCIATADAAPAQDACCASMAADCGTSMAQEHTCCPTESVRLDQQTVAGLRISIAAPDRTSATMLAVMPVAAGIIATAGYRAPDLPPPLRGGPATQFRLSNLRI